MCIWLPLLLMLGTALLTWLATRQSIATTIQDDYLTQNIENENRYATLSDEYGAYVSKNSSIEAQYNSVRTEYDNILNDRDNWKINFSNLTAEKERLKDSHQLEIANLEHRYESLVAEHDISMQAKNKEIETTQTAFAAMPSVERNIEVEKIVEIERIVEVEKIVDRVVEVEKIVEVERIVEVEKIVEVERIVEVEKIVENIVEVEKIVEVERIVEVEKIVDRVVEVEKIIEIERIVEIEKIVEVEKIVEIERIVEVEKIVEVERIVEVEKIVEVIHEIEIIREVPVEIIREIEVTREVDMESLMEMIAQMTTVEVSRSTKETESVIERMAAITVDEPIVETVAIAAVPLEIKPDNLVIIEGIGPKIAELLNNEGIFTFWQLAQTDVNRLKEILNAAGSRFQMHNPGTWPEQSQLAAEGKMSELKQLQIELNAGKKA